jgi:uracil-DNA glycosylase
MPTELDALLTDVRACAHCAASLPLGPRPVVQIGSSASLLIIGQAPGTKVHETGVPWNDPSGDRLREWTGLDKNVFYDPARIAIMPMGFCYPGVAKSGGDAPPRPECAPLWHERLRRHLDGIKLTLLVGQYAQKAYLGKSKGSLTEIVRAYERFLPEYLPLPHPSWRSTGWMKRNPWFEAELVPVLRARVSDALNS